MMESTAVSKTGKITHKDLAIYSKKQASDLKKLLIYLKKLNKKIPIGIKFLTLEEKDLQICHGLKKEKV